LRLFKQQNHVVALDEEAKSAVEVIKNLESKITDTQAALADANARSAMLHNKVGRSSDQAIAMNSLNQSAGVQKVLEEFQQVESQLADQRTRFLEKYPKIEVLKKKRAALKALLQERVKQSSGSVRQASSGNLQIGESKQKLSEDFVKTESERLGLASRLAKLSSNRSGGDQKNVQYEITRNQYENQSRLDLYRIIVSSQKCYTGLQIVF